MSESATDKQKAFLRRLNVNYPESITKFEASKLIDQHATPKPKDVSEDYSKEAPKLSSTSPLGRDTLIVRQSCLKAAVEDCSKLDGISTGPILAIAEEFEKWVNREVKA